MSQETDTTDAPVLSTADKLNSTAQYYLTLIVNKDENAMADFYDATLGVVYALALHITGTAESAEEVVEDVYMQVWRDAKKYDQERARVITWLQTICRSRALDFLRRRDKADTHPDPDLLRKEEDVEEDNPIDLLLVTERDSVIHSAIKELPSVQRQLLGLAFFKGMSHQQISDYLEMPLGTVKTHIRKAINSLQQHPEINEQRFTL